MLLPPQTLAYLLPVMTMAIQRAERLYTDPAARSEGWTVQALVVAPSQELGMQIVRVAQSLLPEEGKTLVQQCIGKTNTQIPSPVLLASGRSSVYGVGYPPGAV